MIVLLGASGYIGRLFLDELHRRQLPVLAVSRKDLNYTRFELLLAFLRQHQPAFLINAAGYTGQPNVDACELDRAETLLGNTCFPLTVAQACQVAGVPWGHVSSGCIYSGAKRRQHGSVVPVRDLNQASIREQLEREPEHWEGFSEADQPNFSFRHPPCSFYSGSKALAEELLEPFERVYIWRLRIPFDEQNHPRNYLTKLLTYPRVYDAVNSLSHRRDFVQSCLGLWENRAPFGIYNVTNPGFVTTRQVVRLITRFLQPERSFDFWRDDLEFYQHAAKTPRSNCILDSSKLLRAGIHLRPVEEALEAALRSWKAATSNIGPSSRP